jgi:hypothetical protein
MHLPVPKERSDDGHFQPLRRLHAKLCAAPFVLGEAAWATFQNVARLKTEISAGVALAKVLAGLHDPARRGRRP